MLKIFKNAIRLTCVRLKYRDSKIESSSVVSLDTILGRGTRIMRGARVGSCDIDRHTYIGSNSEIDSTIIGAFCSIGPQVLCGLGKHPVDYISTYPGFYTDRASGATWFGARHSFTDRPKVTIGSDVWIGARAIIMGDVSIGHGAVIGAGAIVTKNVPPYAIAVGTPAKVIKYRFDEQTIKQLLDSKWWETDDRTLQQLSKHANNPNAFLTHLTETSDQE